MQIADFSVCQVSAVIRPWVSYRIRTRVSTNTPSAHNMHKLYVSWNPSPQGHYTINYRVIHILLSYFSATYFCYRFGIGRAYQKNNKYGGCLCISFFVFYLLYCQKVLKAVWPPWYCKFQNLDISAIYYTVIIFRIQWNFIF